MARTKPSPARRFVEVTLGGEPYQVPRLTYGQWERLRALFDELPEGGPPDRRAAFEHGLAVAAILFERAEPEIEIGEDTECTPAELQAAQAAILAFSGLSQGKATATSSISST